MKAIILAAGKGTRLEPLTLKIPKAMVKVHEKTLLEHNMDKLLPYVDEFIIVVKYKQEIIRDFFGKEYKGIKIRYHEQGEEKGTGAAIKGINTSGELIIAYADAIISSENIHNVMSQESNAVLVKEVSNPEKYGIFESDDNGDAIQVVEKPQKYIGNLANFSFFKVNDSILTYVDQIELSPRGEIELTDAINLFIKDYKLKLVHLEHDIIDITSIEDLEKANTLIKPKLGETQYLENIGEYEIHLGIPKNGIQEIVDYTLDDTDIALRKGTGDWKKRFISIENISSWYNDENRYPFTLLDTNKQVVGIWWGRPAKAPHISEILDQVVYDRMQKNRDDTHTSGIRIYPPARGKGLAGAFLEICTRCYETIFSNIHMSVDIDVENIASIKAFEKNNFKKVGYGKNINNSPETEKQRCVYVHFPNNS